MAASDIIPAVHEIDGSPEPPSAAYLASQMWTPDRVQGELVREDQHWPRYELIGDELLVSPGAHWDHQRVVMELIVLLRPYVEQHVLGEVLMAPADVRLTPTTMVQPDLFVVPPLVSGPSNEWRDITALSLVVEVLSPSTARHDRVNKRAFYTERGVPDYWVVDYAARRVEVSRPGNFTVALYDRELRWQPDGAPEPLVLDIAALFDRVWRRAHA